MRGGYYQVVVVKRRTLDGDLNQGLAVVANY